jgi:ligand-binding SRPBCC domain-containing protein
MRLHRLAARQLLPVPLAEAWEFFSNPANLALITPPSLNLKPTSPLPERMHPGMIITYRISPFPRVGLLWVTEITHVLENQFFVDEQRAGPYRFWHHQHHFSAVEGGTEMRDIVHYALPFGPVGDLFGLNTVRKQVRGIFAYRREVLEQRWGTLPAPQLQAAS